MTQPPPTRPSVVLDYNRATRWRIFDSDHAGKAISRTNLERQGHLL